MSIVSTRQAGLAGFTKYRSLDVASGSPVFYGTKGMILMKPTSITHSGTSATLGANGQVTFTAVTSLSLNGCFTADFDNYVINMRLVASSVDNSRFRLRASGTDATTGYTRQLLVATSTSVTAARASDSIVGELSDGQRSGETFFVYGPFLAQATAFRNVSAGGRTSAMIYEAALTHSTASSYDGFSFLNSGGAVTMTGALQVYGVRS